MASNNIAANLPGNGTVAPSTSSPPAYSEGDTARRKILSIVVGCILQENGCTSVDKAVVGTLVEMLQSSECLGVIALFRNSFYLLPNNTYAIYHTKCTVINMVHQVM